jgi:hypothetical protein
MARTWASIWLFVPLQLTGLAEALAAVVGLRVGTGVSVAVDVAVAVAVAVAVCVGVDVEVAVGVRVTVAVAVGVNVAVAVGVGDAKIAAMDCPISQALNTKSREQARKINASFPRRIDCFLIG